MLGPVLRLMRILSYFKPTTTVQGRYLRLLMLLFVVVAAAAVGLEVKDRVTCLPPGRGGDQLTGEPQRAELGGHNNGVRETREVEPQSVQQSSQWAKEQSKTAKNTFYLCISEEHLEEGEKEGKNNRKRREGKKYRNLKDWNTKWMVTIHLMGSVSVTSWVPCGFNFLWNPAVFERRQNKHRKERAWASQFPWKQSFGYFWSPLWVLNRQWMANSFSGEKGFADKGT